MRKLEHFMGFFIILIFFSFAPGNTEDRELTVKNVREIEIGPEGLPLLSPDGTMMAMCSMNRIVVWTSHGKELLVAEGPGYLDRFTLSWSPDSQYLAVTDDLLNEFEEPDIRLLCVQSGKFENLTDDDVPALALTEPPPPEANLDLSPVWSRDGKSLYFIRINLQNHTNVVCLMKFDMNTRTVSMAKKFEQAPTYVMHSLAIDPGGDVTYLDHPDSDNTFIMRFLEQAEGTILSSVVLDLEWNDPFQVYGAGYSTDGRWLCIRTSHFTESKGHEFISGHDFTFAAPDSKQLVLRSTETHILTGFCWNPFQEDTFMYTLIAPEKSGLYCCRPNGRAKLLLEGHFVAEGYGVSYHGSRLTWSNNDTILLYDYKQHKLLLATLEMK
ncbi:MAG: PD40 domain-containing protein [Spirochaetales bacterium]|nr:PD40 domain-containing protein [Spirochaetales bacterium]